MVSHSKVEFIVMMQSRSQFANGQPIQPSLIISSARLRSKIRICILHQFAIITAITHIQPTLCIPMVAQKHMHQAAVDVYKTAS